MEKNSKILRFALPLIGLLSCLVVYNYMRDRVGSEMTSIRERSSTTARTLEKSLEAIAEKPDLEKRLAGLREKRKADESKLIEGETAALAAANLGSTVKELITARQGTVSSERVEKPEELGRFKIVAVSMDVVLHDAKALADVVYSIETRTPYIVLKEVDARVSNFREPRELMVRLKVAALTGGK